PAGIRSGWARSPVSPSPGSTSVCSPVAGPASVPCRRLPRSLITWPTARWWARWSAGRGGLGERDALELTPAARDHPVVGPGEDRTREAGAAPQPRLAQLERPHQAGRAPRWRRGDLESRRPVEITGDAGLHPLGRDRALDVDRDPQRVRQRRPNDALGVRAGVQAVALELAQPRPPHRVALGSRHRLPERLG